MTKAEEIAFRVLHNLKHETKQINASLWSKEYRILAEIIHSGTRDFESAIRKVEQIDD